MGAVVRILGGELLAPTQAGFHLCVGVFSGAVKVGAV